MALEIGDPMPLVAVFDVNERRIVLDADFSLAGKKKGEKKKAQIVLNVNQKKHAHRPAPASGHLVRATVGAVRVLNFLEQSIVGDSWAEAGHSFQARRNCCTKRRVLPLPQVLGDLKWAVGFYRRW